MNELKWQQSVQYLLSVALLGFITTSCVLDSNKISGKLENPLPCWFFKPVNENNIGVMGLAKTTAVGVDPLVLAKKRALQGVSTYLKLNLSDHEVSSLATQKQNHLKVAGHSLNFVDQLIHQDYWYTYVVLDQQSNSIETPICQANRRVVPETCQPEWLCHFGSSDNMAGFLGVSAPAASGLFSDQYRYAVENAIKMIEYLYGVSVSTDEKFSRYRSGASSFRIRIRQRDIRFEPNQIPHDIRLIVKEVALQGQRLYVWVLSPDISVLAGMQDLQWMKNPQYKGWNGEVGIASANASGLFSSQIQQSIEDGLSALIKNRQVHVTETLTTSRNTSMQSGHQTASAKIKAKVMGMHIKNNRIYTWVVEQPNHNKH